MNLLYAGKYRNRFCSILNEIAKFPTDSKIIELCFGDSPIPRFCMEHGYRWTGFDINDYFVGRALGKGFDARLIDVSTIPLLPKGDLYIMAGSLYHFHPQPEIVLSKMIDAAPCVIVSEPVRNLSSMRGIIGFLARRATNAGKGNEKFRFNATSFRNVIKRQCVLSNCSMTIIEDFGKDHIVKFNRNGKN